MPNRILRDWTTSETIDKLSPEAEVFFIRLIMKADDYGNYTANPKLLNAALFPLKNYTPEMIEGWIDECHEIVKKYNVKGKEYINIPDFGQRLRAMKSHYPDICQSDDGHVSDIRPLETKRNEVETETEVVTVWPSFEDFWNFYDKKTERPKCEKKWKKLNQEVREKIMSHLKLYIFSTPDKTYRKNPTTYLNNECWNDEIIIKNHGQTTKEHPAQAAARAFAERHGSKPS